MKSKTLHLSEAKKNWLKIKSRNEPMSVPQNFRTYDLSIQFYRECKKIKLPHALKDQLNWAASSIPLNLVEGSAKPSIKERLRYYSIAFGSIREI